MFLVNILFCVSITDMQSDYRTSRPVEFNDLVLTSAGLSSRLLETILVLIQLMLNKGSQWKEHNMAEWEERKPGSACAVTGYCTGCRAFWAGEANVCQMPDRLQLLAQGTEREHLPLSPYPDQSSSMLTLSRVTFFPIDTPCCQSPCEVTFVSNGPE